MRFTLKGFQSPPLCSLSVYAHAHTMLRYIGYRPLTETGREKKSVSVQRNAWHRTKKNAPGVCLEINELIVAFLNLLSKG